MLAPTNSVGVATLAHKIQNWNEGEQVEVGELWAHQLSIVQHDANARAMHTHLLTIMISRMYRKQALITLLMLFAFVALLSCEQCHHQLTAILGAPKEERPHGTPFASSSLRRQQSASVDVVNDSTLVEPITQISILGERNSGTSWTFE